ncbi:MAG: glycoside hydrolase family 92 protein, partial [Bacteroidota bacterium]
MLISFFSCTEDNKHIDRKADYVRNVDPMIGTDGFGHTFPGVVLPHGMVQLSPDTDVFGWDRCAGYHYSDSTIVGFSHTHFSGTGVGDLGDIMIMPAVGSLNHKRGTSDNPEEGYRSRFSHNEEIAEVG